MSFGREVISSQLSKCDDLSLEVRGNTIRIFGKKAVDYGGNVSMHRLERIAGTFDRTISLPVQLDPDRIMAEYRDGILSLSTSRSRSASSTA